ncbi:hypothetical protein [uncultured Bacteroides sp.]|uniref:hypothetical protein n=1 Tax=uncultured Bacteroides sp. TaxID=162156 RepID=UPI002675DB5F|nr:hypothetical protein [uncultured Bacteroides sp.]
MKNCYFLIMLFLFVGMYSCSQDDFMDNSLITDTSSTWKKQLDYIVAGEGSKLLVLQNLELLYYDVLTSPPVKNDYDIMNDDCFPLYNDSNDINHFQLMTYQNIKEKYNEISNILIDKKKKILKRFSQLSVIELHWSVQERLFTTRCIVCDTCVVYDDILSNFRYVTVNDNREQMTYFPRTKSLEEGSWSGGGSGDSSESKSEWFQYEYDSGEYTATDWLGQIRARASCVVRVKGEKKDGKISIKTKDEKCYFNAKDGFSATSEVKYLSFETGENGHCDYKFGVLVGNSVDLTLSWNGSGFTIPGGARGKTGGKYVIPEHLTIPIEKP